MKKILSIIIISLVGLLVATTVVLAVVNTTLYNPITEGAKYIRVYKNGDTQGQVYDDETDEYSKVYELNNNSVKQNILSTMFQGALGNNTKLEKVSETTISSVISADTAGYFVEFGFTDEDKTFIWEGEEYTYEKGTTTLLLKYDALYLQVENTTSYTKTTVYVVLDGKYNHKVTTLTHQSDLYEYVSELNWPGK